MNGDGKEKGLATNSSQRTTGDHTSQRGDTDKGLMEALGRGFSDLYRNSSEELILRSLMESPLGISSAPSLEMLGFKNISQTLRRDSEELFNSWLMNGEIPGFSSTNIAHRSRQASRRISTELAVSSHQNGVGYQKRSSDDNLCQPNLRMVEELSNDISHSSLRNAAEKGPSSLYLAKAWFHSTQPMTRSRSSELRKRYAAMQNSQTPIIVEAPNNPQVGGTNKMEQAFGNPNSLCDIPPGDMSSQLQTFISPSNSSSSPFNTPSMATVDTVSSVVSMLKGTLERKKLVNQADKEGNSFHFYSSQEVTPHIGSNQDTATHIIEPPKTFHGLSPIQLKETGNWSKSERSVELNMEGYVMPPSQIQLGTMSREPSPSESSAAAPVHSTGFEVCDGPAYSGQTLSICESSRKHIGNGTPEHESKTREFRERICESNLKNDRKKGSLARMGSISSGCSVDKGDPTKKRRVERSRKMAEAKERNSVPMLPSDMQSVLKRCETLEKEVRSLKLNLSFMNRKDSEQTKQIEELQKQNEELSEEKERLLEEIERIISDPHKM